MFSKIYIAIACLLIVSYMSWSLFGYEFNSGKDSKGAVIRKAASRSRSSRGYYGGGWGRGYYGW